MNSKILTLLGFCSKAGKMSYGMDASVESLKKGKSNLVVVASDVSQKSLKEITFNAEKAKVKVTVLGDTNIDTLSHAVGRKCGILSVNDKGFAEAIEKEIFSKNIGK